MPQNCQIIGVNSVTNIELDKGVMPAPIIRNADWFEKRAQIRIADRVLLPDGDDVVAVTHGVGVDVEAHQVLGGAGAADPEADEAGNVDLEVHGGVGGEDRGLLQAAQTGGLGEGAVLCLGAGVAQGDGGGLRAPRCR